MTVVNGFRLVSNSEIQTFKQCQRKWWLQWFRGLAPKGIEVQGIRATGTRVHIAMEALYQPEPGDALGALVSAQSTDMAIAEASEFTDMKKLLSDFQTERIMVEGYLEWLQETGADAHLEVVGSEIYLEAELPGVYGRADLPPVKIIGKVDTRVRDTRTGEKRFIDTKTVTTFLVPMLSQNQQILHYELLESLQPGGERSAGAYYNMLRRVKRSAKAVPPFYKRVTITHNQHEIDNYTQHLVGVVTNIQLAERYLMENPDMHHLVAYPTPHRDCSWKCPFVKECRLFDDGSRVEDALANGFTTINPLDYYQGKEVEE